MTDENGLILMSAPNGARRQKADHPTIPLTPEEIAECAKKVLEAGASVLHMHVRDKDGRHSLDPNLYNEATGRVWDAVGNDLIIQITTESGGLYGPEEQIATVKMVRPEAVSVAFRELCKDTTHEARMADFLAWMRQERIWVQHILYSEQDARRLHDFWRRGYVPEERPFVLIVLGSYAHLETSDISALDGMVTALGDMPADWMVCAFGQEESRAACCAAELGGHVRLGFENNMMLPDGTVATDNADLIRATLPGIMRAGRPLLSADQVRPLFP